jgi:hypothetical protein
MNFKKSKNIDQSIRIVDVKRTVCFMLVMALFSTFSLNAQTVPDPPKPPQTSSSSSTSHSISVDNDDDQNTAVRFLFQYRAIVTNLKPTTTNLKTKV